MPLIPSPHVLQVRSPVTGAIGVLGNPTVTWSAARPWAVRQVDPGRSMEPYLPNRDLSNVEYAIHADRTGDAPAARDEVQVDGEWYAVDGEPADWSRGPWHNPVAGVVVLLRRTDG